MREERSALRGHLKTWKHKGPAVPDSLQHTVNFGIKSPTDTESANNLKYGKKILSFFFFPLFHDVGASCFFFSLTRREANIVGKV